MLAFDNVLVNIDSYIGTFKQNYYLYKDDNGRFNAIVWDLRYVIWCIYTNWNHQFKQYNCKKQMTHLLHANDAAWPLVSKTYKLCQNTRECTLLIFERFWKKIFQTIVIIRQPNLIKVWSHLPFKRIQINFTYAQFQSNLTTDNTGGMNPAPGITNLMNGRYTDCLNEIFTNSLCGAGFIPPVICHQKIYLYWTENYVLINWTNSITNIV